MVGQREAKESSGWPKYAGRLLRWWTAVSGSAGTVADLPLMVPALSGASFLLNLLHLVKYTLSSLKPETLANCFYHLAHSGCLPMSLWWIEIFSLSFISFLCMNPICSVSLPDRTEEAGLWSLLEFPVCWALLSLLLYFHSPLQMLGIWRKLINQWVRESLMLCLGLLSFSGPRGAEEGLLSRRQSWQWEPGFGSGHWVNLGPVT